MASMAFTSLAAPAHEDNMEMSSPAANNLYDDDLDLDIPLEDNHTDDERMLEDGEPPRPGMATDEEMGDDDPTLNTQVTEEEMQDDPLDGSYLHDYQYDEDLIDYDDGFADPAQSSIDNANVHNAEGSFDFPGATEDVDEETVRQPEQRSVEPVEKPAAVEAEETTEVAPPQEEPATEAADAVEATITQSAPDDEIHTAAEAIETAVTTGDAEEPALEHVPAEEESGEAAAFAEDQDYDDESSFHKPPPQLPGTLDTSLGQALEGPPTPTDTGLHPMTVKFSDYKMPLFKSKRQIDGLLKDDNLASVSLADLLQHCRQRILIKIGENCVTTQQDLVLHFEQLHLFINENSHCASITSLNDVLDVFTKFHENADSDVPPLSLFLQVQPNFTKSMSALRQAAAEGRDLSEVFQISNDTTNHRDEYDEDYKEEGYGESQENSNGEAQQYDAHHLAGETEHAEQHDAPNDVQEYDEEAGYQYDTTVLPGSQEGEGYEGYDALGPIPDPEEDDQQYEEAEPEPDTATALLEDHEGEQEALEPTEFFESTGEATRDPVEPRSSATTAAAADASAYDTTGEYDPEDMIDFDEDEGLTDPSSEAPAHDGNDEISELLRVDDKVDVENTKDSQAQPEAQGDNSATTLHAAVQTARDTDEPANADDDDELALNFDSEDYVNGDNLDYPAEEEEEEDRPEDQEGLRNEYDQSGEDPAEYGEDGPGQADSVDFDDGDDIQPGDESEQYHTAYDLLENDGDEYAFEEAAHDGEQQEDSKYNDEDDIGYEDDDDLNDQLVSTATGTSNSPLGKRSFEELADEDELDFDEPKSKKARSD
ncbi:Hypothetical predicted protein [Lecanosticta acicola]|uniref:Uncharacterized protein n=1 Tax=Lecanosticta acicola TaxID=111012 RepID=A0AAI8Z0K3_9PEZI|nr:Hypothetical predicted protein [Lecanosticta acicola]